MNTRLTTILAALCLGCVPVSQAQQAGTVITENPNARFCILIGAAGARAAAISPDGRYVGGSFPGDAGTAVPGYIYDIERDSVWITETPADFVVSPDHYAGDGYIYLNGELISIKTRSNETEGYYATSSTWAASRSRDTLVTMSHEQEDDPELGREVAINYAYLVDGRTGEILYRVEPHWPRAAGSTGFGERVNGCNDDATILAGHSTLEGAGNNWSPVFWDLKNDTSFFVGTDDNGSGSLSVTNNDGSLIAGSARASLVLIHYDKENCTYTLENLPMAPGMGSGGVTGITETGWVLMYQAISSTSGDRTGYLYNINDGSLVTLEEYVRELYGLTAPIPYFTPMSISDDGRRITGWSTYQSTYVPYVLALGENQIFARPRSFTANQYMGEMTVSLSWLAPLESQYTLQGYNVFCDSVQLNAELIPAGELEYLQTEGVEAGVHEYAVQAVYAEGVSDYSEVIRLLVVEEGGCFPVQEIGSNVVYNRQVEVYWGLPSAQMGKNVNVDKVWDGTLRAAVTGTENAAGRRIAASASKSYQNGNLDLISYEPFDTYGYSSSVIVGDRLYTGNYNTGAVYEFNLADMSLVETYAIEGIGNISNMVHRDGQLYLATQQEEILVVDLADMSISNHLVTAEGVEVVHLCYIPELDNGNGGFAYGDWFSLHFCNRFGREIDPGVSIDVEGLAISGSVYYDGKLYLFSQSGTNMAELYTVDFATGEFLGKKDLSKDARLGAVSTYGFVAGGLSMNLLPDSTVALGAMLQFSATNSHIAFLEVESAPGLLGYNLYRNGEQVNPEGEYIQGLSYKEALMEPGDYTYTVESVNEGGCTNMLEDVKTTVTINPIGECAGPEGLTAAESHASVMLDWDYTAEDGPALVGFNIYRDGELLTDGLLNLEYTDPGRSAGTYLYKVEAFHDNSCVASDSVEIEVTLQGTAMPPSHLSLDPVPADGNTNDVAMAWELPYFETPLAIGYCGLPYSGTGLTDGSPMWCLVGWDSEGLDAYRDLYIVGMEYFIGEGITNLDALVYLNDTLALRMPVTSRIRENDWNTFMFGEYIPMDQPMEALVGYRVEYSDASAPVAVFDMGPAVQGYGDLLSTDGQQWSTLTASGLSANWCINALVVNRRDLEAAAKYGKDLDELVYEESPLVKVMSLGALDLGEPKPVQAAKATSENVKLVGFNAYRDGNLLNAERLTSLSYVDEGVAPGSYEYYVTAVYQDGEEVPSESVLLDVDVANEKVESAVVKVGPNPATDYVRVEGAYASVDVLSLSGKRLVRYEGGNPEISLSGLSSGVYMLKFTLLDGTVELHKLIVG